MVAGAAHEIVESGAFAPKNEDAVAGQVELVVVGRASFIESDGPDIALLEIFECANEIDNPGDAE